MPKSKTVFDQAHGVTALLKNYTASRRLAIRRRLYTLINEKADQLIAEKGAASARGECIRRVAFCAQQAQGARWTIWQRIHAIVRERTGYDDSKRVRIKDYRGVS